MTGLGEAVPLTAGAIWRRSLPVWAGLMLLLTFADVLNRAAPTQPGTVMPRSIPEMPATGQRAF